ncbi:hypothetical protein HDV06_002269 [Boothiomyces sp. JEL0866]|nr:hypothetical protein HDV06_002269 [Boothiomyces sp. JEL0866]
MLATFLQNELMLLSTESKKKNPEIKDAAERLLYLIRTYKEGNLNPDLELSKTEETLTPLLLSFDTKNPKLITISVGCFQKLISHNAIPPTSIGVILKSLSNIMGTSQDLQLKILQTILPLVTNYTQIHDELLGQALLLCFHLHDSKNTIVGNTASATFRQLVLHTFEKLYSQSNNVTPGSNELQDITESSKPINNALKLYENDAFVLFQDLCMLINGEPGSFLKVNSIQKAMGLEIIESIISTCPKLFTIYPDLLSLVKDKVCPLIVKLFSEKAEFPLTVRLIRVIKSMVKHFSPIIPMPCEIFLTMFGRILGADNYPAWQRILVLECYKVMFHEPGLQRSLFETFDKNQHCANIYSDIVNGVSSVMFGAKDYMLYYSPPEKGDPSGADAFFLSSVKDNVKMLCLDQLDKPEPPSFPDAYPLYLSYCILISIVDCQHDYIIPIINQTPEEGLAEMDAKKIQDENNEAVFLAIEMANTVAAGAYSSLTLLSVSSVDDLIFNKIAKAIEKFVTVVGLLGLVPYRDAFLGTLCKTSVSSQIPTYIDYSSSPKEIEPFDFTQLHNRAQPVVVSDRNIMLFNTMVQSSCNLSDVMDQKIWFAVLETIQLYDSLMSTSNKSVRRLESSPNIGEAPPPLVGKDSVRLRSTTLTFMESYATKVPPIQSVQQPVENQSVQYRDSVKKIFEKSATMKRQAFLDFCRSLCRLAHETMAGHGIIPPGVVIKEVSNEKSFAITKILEIAHLNIKRLVDPNDFTLFDLLINQLIQMVHSSGCSAVIRNQTCFVFGELLICASNEPVFSNEAVELHIIDPLMNLMAFEPVPATEGSLPNLDVAPSDNLALKLPWLQDVRKSGLDIVNKLLQNSGQNFKAGWNFIFDLIYMAVKSSCPPKKKENTLKPILESGSPVGITESPATLDGSFPLKNNSLIRVGFPSIQLICTDFLSLLSPLGLSKLIDTVSVFGSIAEELNISLTAVGLLWTICDYILTKRQALEKEKPIEEVEPKVQSLRKESLKSAFLDFNSTELTLTAKTMDSLWMYLLHSLSELCSDDRPEVRNSANQTLFRTISMNGQRLTLESWELCITHVLFPLIERIQNLNSQATSKTNTEKQWDESKSLTLNGITKWLIDFLPVLIDLGEKFDKDWITFLNYIKSSCLLNSQDVASAALKNLRILAQYPKNFPDHQERLQTKQKHLWKELYNIWLQIGQGIIDQADKASGKEFNLIQWSNGTFPNLISGPFTQDCLAIYFSIIFDIYPSISKIIGQQELQEISDVLKNLLLYHSKIPAGATNTRIKADFVNDLENPTPTQNLFYDFISGKIDFTSIPHSQEIVAFAISDAILFPFITFGTTNESMLDISNCVNNVTSPKKHTFMAICKKCLLLLEETVNQKDGMDVILKSGAFEAAVKALGILMKYKYGCPQSGTKEPTPIWKIAVRINVKLISLALEVLNDLSGGKPNLVGEIEKRKLDQIYKCVISVSGDFVLSSSQPMVRLLPEELNEDEAIDIQVLDLLKTEALTFFGDMYMPEDYCREILNIFSKVASHQLNPPLPTLPFKSNGGGHTPSMSLIGSPAVVPVKEVEIDEVAFKLDANVLKPWKENIAIFCIESLFEIGSVKENSSKIEARVAGIAESILLEKCRSVISEFVSDRVKSGKQSLPKFRNSEVSSVLKGLQKLQVAKKPLMGNHGIHYANSELSNENVKDYLLCSPISIQYQLYTRLIELLSVASGSLWLLEQGTEEYQDEAQIVDLTKSCLLRIGEIFTQ